MGSLDFFFFLSFVFFVFFFVNDYRVFAFLDTGIPRSWHCYIDLRGYLFIVRLTFSLWLLLALSLVVDSLSSGT